MSIKVVDETPDPSVVKRTVCKTCGVKIEYVPLDVQKRTKRDYTGGTDDVFFLLCPKCQCEVHVSAVYHDKQGDQR